MTRVQNLMPSECLWLCTTVHVAAACLVHYSSVIASAQDFLDAILAVGQRAFPGSQPRRVVEQASETPERARVPSDSIYPFLACRFSSNWPELDACLSPDDFSEAQNGQGHGDHVMKRERKESQHHVCSRWATRSALAPSAKEVVLNNEDLKILKSREVKVQDLFVRRFLVIAFVALHLDFIFAKKSRQG